MSPTSSARSVGRQYEPGRVYNLCVCGAPLLVRYDLRRAAETMVRERISSRPPTLWRYREVLPVANDASILCLGEGFTPLIHARRLGSRLGLPNLYLKDEALNPTGSFKARGLAVAVSMADGLGAAENWRFLPRGTPAGPWPLTPDMAGWRRRSLCLRKPPS